MTTISAKQFFANGNVTSVGNEGDIQQHEKDTMTPHPITTELQNNIKNRVSGVSDQIKNVYDTAIDPNLSTSQKIIGGLAEAGKTPLKVAGAIGGTVGDVVGAGVEATGLSDKISKAVSGSSLSDSLGKAAEQWKTFSEKNPELAASLKDVGNLINLVPAGAVEKSVGSKLGTTLEESFNKELPAIGTSKNITPFDDALSRVTPKYDEKLVGKKVTQAVKDETGANKFDTEGKLMTQQVPRVNEGGTIKGRTVNPSIVEHHAADELSKVPGYDSKMSNLELHDLADREVTKTAQTLDESLKGEKQIVPKRQIVKTVSDAISKVPENSLILQKADPVIKNYVRVVTNAAKQNDGTLQGALNVRKAMDAAYENVRGKSAYGDQTINALDEVHSAGRDALNEFLVNSAKNTQVKELLLKQNNLYNAMKGLLPRAQEEAGSTLEKIKNFVTKHPAATYMTAAATGGGLLGAGLRDLLK